MLVCLIRRGKVGSTASSSISGCVVNSQAATAAVLSLGALAVFLLLVCNIPSVRAEMLPTTGPRRSNCSPCSHRTEKAKQSNMLLHFPAASVRIRCFLSWLAACGVVCVLLFLHRWSALVGWLSVLECAFWGFLPLFTQLHLFPLSRLSVTHTCYCLMCAAKLTYKASDNQRTVATPLDTN